MSPRIIARSFAKPSKPSVDAAPFGIATSNGLLSVTSIDNATAKLALIFVLDPAKAGAQKPLAIVGGPASKLQAPYALAIGP